MRAELVSAMLTCSLDGVERKPIHAMALLLWATNALAADVPVSNATELRRAVADAMPGTRILLAPGEYAGGFHFSNVRGETNRPVVIAAADPTRPPIIRGGGTGLHFSDPAFLTLEYLTLTGWSGNGLNIDDGGSFDTPARGVVLRQLIVTNTGPAGNR